MNESSALRVYAADLRHNFSGVLSVDAMPLSVGYIKSVLDRELPAGEVQTRIFAYPDALLAAMREVPPDVLMVGNYMWNESLGHYFLRAARQINPHVLAVMGGPNISEEPERQIDYVAAHPEIDVYVCGEADFVASEIVQRLLEADRRPERLLEQDLPSCVQRRGDEVVRTATRPRSRDLDEIPSPYLTGVMDEFFDGKLAPMIETNRGCPFKCKFCVQGTGFYNKVNHFDLDRLHEEIRYIAKRNHEHSPAMGTLRIADPNFGMYKRDVQIAEFLGEAQAAYTWPTFIDATTGKNKPERILECLEKVNGALVLYQAVQSLDDEVLRNIDRSNIKLSSYEQIMVHVRGRGLRSNSDLILGLPGESLESHLRGLHKLVDAGTDQAHCFQAMVLKGSDLETIEMRERFGYLTRFRVLPKNYGIYDGEKVFDIEEIIVGTDTLPFEDYLECRRHHLTFSIFWNDSWFDDVVRFVRRAGIEPSTWLRSMLDAMKEDDGVVRGLLDDFVDETENELFATRDECEAFYARDDNFERLRRGEIGDNLMYKYRAKASFFEWPAVCAVAMRKTRSLLAEHGVDVEEPGFDLFWSELGRVVEARHAAGQSIDEIMSPVKVTVSHDFERWFADDCPLDVAVYRLPQAREVEFRLTSSGAEELDRAIRVWSAELVGLTKLVTRIRISSQIREPHPVAAAL